LFRAKAQRFSSRDREAHLPVSLSPLAYRVFAPLREILTR
jgi:hypothetical protein